MKSLGFLRRSHCLLSASLLAVAIIACSTAVPMNRFRSADVTGTIIPLIHDGAVISVVPSATEIYVDWSVNITVVIKNEGNTAETFAVTCKYILEGVEHLIGTQTVTNLAPLTSTTLTFNWKVTDVTTHTIKAEIPTLPNETDTTDNTLTSPTPVKVKMTGDVNGDGIVSITDLVVVALAFGSTVAEPNIVGYPYDHRADLNDDGIINIIDLVIVAINFGKKLPL